MATQSSVLAVTSYHSKTGFNQARHSLRRNALCPTPATSPCVVPFRDHIAVCLLGGSLSMLQALVGVHASRTPYSARQFYNTALGKLDGDRRIGTVGLQSGQESRKCLALLHRRWLHCSPRLCSAKRSPVFCHLLRRLCGDGIEETLLQVYL